MAFDVGCHKLVCHFFVPASPLAFNIAFVFLHVVKVLARRTERGRALVRVRWKGFSAADDTWEDERELLGPPV